MNYKLCEDVTIEEVDNNSILVSEKGDAAILNETAAQILKLLLAGQEVQKIAEIIAKDYGIDEHTVRNDVEELICELADKKLVLPASAVSA
jgi:hypothetical protein